MMRILKKHKGFLIVLLILLLAFGVYRVYSWIQGEPREDLLYTQEYIPGTRNIKGDVDIEKWEALGCLLYTSIGTMTFIKGGR